MKRVFKCSGVAASVAHANRHAQVVPVLDRRGKPVAATEKGHGSKSQTVGKNRRQIVPDSIDLSVLNNAHAFKSPISAHRCATSRKLSSAVNIR